ncbi:hypothetical protein BMG00_07985 [Thioclava marina]|uniref:Polysaccharide pyruvyl transferase domain-containing protein n=1 Tax=Thioclava marina TaxID=1915077 RepID=A0ABX3MQ66_9RHOB|nr:MULTISPECIES: polysaccharide pyruvyl transferase family protein [Thioclava]OOY13690.1 hypothetical protein BMG00_07985 [Thioclava marina]OOY29397.1 hypothetical protein BMI90_03900 [Thioclava sp. L04-15]TNE85274.1 MAG: polysaccharide pyruvyl transferase family protein [Paracoccaceae bacterium]
MARNIETVKPRRALLMGALSTVGDVEVLHQVTRRLRDLGVPFEVAPFSKRRTEMFDEWVDVSTLDPRDYSHVVFVCGPLTRKMMEKRWETLRHFEHCAFIGVNLTMVADLEAFNPFDALIERDSNRVTRPDLSFLQEEPRVPVLGLCLVDSQREYGSRQRHAKAKDLLEGLIRRSGAACIEIDTVLAPNRQQHVENGFYNAAQFESAVARVDVLLTTRLHGTVLALKNGVPAISIDAVLGGDKVSRQTREIGWEEVFEADSVTEEELDRALERCLLPDARERARACADHARNSLANFDAGFSSAMSVLPDPALRSGLRSRQGLVRKFRSLLTKAR